MRRAEPGSGRAFVQRVVDASATRACAVLALAAALLCAAPAMHAVDAAPVTLPAQTLPSLATSPQTDDRLAVAGRSANAFGPEERAQELYLDAMAKLDAGDAVWAGRTFSDVIERFPDSTAAGLARLRLGELAAGRPPAKSIVPPAAKQPPATVGHGPAWDQELRRNAAIQAKLRADAGDRVFFGSGAARLGTRANAAISAQAQWLKQWREFEAAIEGHADDPGSDADNLKLAQQRAEAVRQRLVAEGVDSSRLAIVAMGRADPVATCSESACAAQNRRVVTLVFAPGTRERLGLVPIESAEASEPLPPGTAPSAAEPAPPAAKPVGLTR